MVLFLFYADPKAPLMEVFPMSSQCNSDTTL